MSKHIQVNLEDDDYRNFKILCAIDGLTSQEKLTEMITGFIGERRDVLQAIEKRRGKS